MRQIIRLQFPERFTVRGGVGEKHIRYFVRRTVFDDGTFEPCRIRDEEEDLAIVIAGKDAHLSMRVTGQLHTDDGAVAKQVVACFEGRVFFGKQSRFGHVHFLRAGVKVCGDESAQEGVFHIFGWAQIAESVKGVGKVDEAGPTQIGERADMVRVEVGDEDVGNIRRFYVEGCKLVDDQIFFAQVNRRHPTIKAVREFFCLVEEAIGVARVEEHRAKFWVAKEREHGREVNAAPASAADGEVFGGGAVACVKNIDFHESLLNTKYTKGTKEKPWCTSCPLCLILFLPPSQESLHALFRRNIWLVAEFILRGGDVERGVVRQHADGDAGERRFGAVRDK